MKIRELNISARSRSCLLNAGYTDVEDLKDIDDDTLLSIKNLNQTCVAEIRNVIIEYFSVGDELSETKISDSLTKVNINYMGFSSDSCRPTNDESEYVDKSHADIMDYYIEDLDLSPRSYHSLKRAGINTVGELCNKIHNIDDLRKIRNMGRKHVIEICDSLYKLGIELSDYEEIKVREDNQISSVVSINTSIDEIGLSSKIYLCLQSTGINTLGDLCSYTYEDMFAIPGLSRKGLDTIVSKLQELGVQFRPLSEQDVASYRVECVHSNESVTDCSPKESMSSNIDMSSVIDSIGLSLESCDSLKKAGIYTLGDLCNKTSSDVPFILNLSHKNIDEILSKVNELGFQFKKIPDVQQYSVQDTFCDSIDLSTLVKTLKLSFKTKLYLRRNEVDTVRDLCRISEADFDSSLNLTQYKEEIVSQMNLVGVCFRPENESSCLYLYPSRVKKIAYEKRSGWEYRLFVEAALTNYSWLSQFRNQALNLWEYEDEDDRIDSADKLSKLITEKNSEITAYTHEIDDCMEKDIYEALSLQGNPGNVDQIICATEKLFDIYKSIIKSRFSFSIIDASYKYRNSISLLCDIYEECLCNVFDVLNQKLLIAKKQIDDMINGLISYKDVSVDLNVPLVLNVSKISKALDDITEDTTSTFKHVSVLDSDTFRIDFCGFHLKKNKQNENITDIKIRIWYFNHSDETKKIWLKDLFVNGRTVSIDECLNTENIGNHGYQYIEIGYFFENTLIIDDESCEDISEIQFTVEIDDADDQALEFSKTITAGVDPLTKEVHIKSIEDFLSTYSVKSNNLACGESDENSKNNSGILGLPHISSFQSR